MELEFLPLSKAILDETKNKWVSLIGEDTDYNPVGYYQFLDFSEAKLNNTTSAPDSHCYAVLNKGEEYATALFSLTHALPQSPEPWVKVLDMRTSPCLDLRVPESIGDSIFDRREMIGKVIPFGLINILKLTYSTHLANKLKIWGNKQVDLDLFKIFKDLLSSDAELNHTDLGFEFDTYSNWLEINKKQ
jgi:hypothetical protein